MSSVLSRLFAVRSVDSILEELDTAPPMNRVLTARSLTAIGLGSTFGAGVFIFTGQVAAQNAGPASTLALLIAALGSAFAAICYAEFAAMIPVSGSAYTYTYAALGEALAWIVGWNLALEYMMSASAVAVSWSGYVVSLAGEWGVELPAALVKAPLAKAPEGGLQFTGAILNVPAVALIALLGWVCYAGVRQFSAANTAENHARNSSALPYPARGDGMDGGVRCTDCWFFPFGHIGGNDLDGYPAHLRDGSASACWCCVTGDPK